jgi:hypothetical protein
MTYLVYALTTQDEEKIESTDSFTNYEDALAYYQNTFRNQADQIIDYGGTHVIMLYAKDNDKGVRVFKRHTIETTFNTSEND